MDEDAGEDCAPPLAIGRGEHTVESRHTARVGAASVEPEPAEDPHRPVAEPGALHEHDRRDDDDLDTEQGHHGPEDVDGQIEA